MNAQQRRVARRATRAQVQAAVDLWQARREALLARVLAGPNDNAGFAQQLRTLVQMGVSVSPAPQAAQALYPSGFAPGLSDSEVQLCMDIIDRDPRVARSGR